MKINKLTYQLMSAFVLLALTFGSYASAGASSAPIVAASANTYYVSATGNDANSGTLESPFKTITKAMNVAQAGYSIYVRAGTYPSFTVSKNNLIISGYPGERPILSGGTGIRLSGENITLSNFEVANMTASLSAGITSFGNNNIIQNNVVHDNIYVDSSGIIIAGSYNQVLDNVAYNNNKFGIGIYGSTATNNIVSRNTTYNHTLSAGDSDGIHCSGDAKNNTFSENITYGNSDDGLDTWTCTNNLVTKNVAHHNGGTGDGNGFKLGLGGGNTAIGNTSYSNYTCGFTSNGAGNYYENNTSYSNALCGFDDNWRVSGNTQTSSFINNIAYENSKNYLRGQYTTVFTGNSEASTTVAVSATPIITFTPTPIITAPLVAALSANAYYVSVSGNDANVGSLSAPFRTIQKCINVAVAGSSCLVKAGTYNENLIINKSGTSSSPITLARYEGEAVTINGGTGYAVKDSGSSSYWIIDGFTITTTGSSSTAILVTSSDWGGSTPTHWTIRNNTMLGGGVLIRGNYNLVENNTINGQHLAKSGNTWQNGIRDTWGGGAVGNASPTHHNVYRGNTIFGFSRSGIWSMGYTHDNIIEYNRIYDIYDTGNMDAGQCINLDGAATVEWRHIVRGNDVSGCASVSIALENVFDTLIENNYVHDTTQGITSINYGSVGCKVGGENNQYGDTDGDGHCVDANTNNIVRQNVVVNASSDAFVNYGMDGGHYLNNSAYGGKATMIFSLPQYLKYSDAIGNITTSTLPTGFRANSNNINPSGAYANPPSNLSPMGAALDKITAVDTFQNSVTGSWLLDFAGNPRLAGSSYDIGAYEFLGANTVTSTPISPANTVVPTATPLPELPTSTPVPMTVIPTESPVAIETASTAPTVIASLEPTVTASPIPVVPTLTSEPPIAVPANTYYVSVSGNDANVGSLSAPFRTIQKCINIAVAGSSCLVRAGTYNENLIINKSGTATNPITLAKYQNEAVILNGGTNYTIKDSGSSNYWIIDGLTITTTGASSTAILVTSSDWGGSTPAHWIIRNNTLLGGGVLIRGSYHLVENNTINGQHLAKDGNTWQNGIRDTWGGGAGGNASQTHHNVYSRNTIFGFARSGIWSMGYTHDEVVEYNKIYDIYATGGQCINFGGAGTVEWRNIVRGNDISGCASVSIALENVFDTLVENNYIHDTAQGISLVNYTASVGCKVGGENNQYGDTDGDGSCIDANTNNIIRQNVVVNATADAFMNSGMDGVHYLNNSAYGGKATMIFSLPQYLKYSDAIGNITTSTLPTGFRTNSNNINPSGAYTNPPSNLSPMGAALDKIAAVDTFQNSVTGSWLLDFSGNPRLAGSSYDIGAYEFLGANTVTATPVPLMNTVVPTASPLAELPTSTPVPLTVIPTESPVATETASMPAPTATASPTPVPPTFTATSQPTSTVAPAFTPTSVPPTSTATPQVPSTSQRTYDDTDSAFVYSAGWKSAPSNKSYNGSFMFTTVNGSSATLAFTGQSFSVLYKGGPSFRKMDVYVDGVLVGTIDEKTGIGSFKQRWNYSGQLALGPHTLKLVFVTPNTSNVVNGSIDAVIIR